MAVQMHFAFSSLFKGAAIFAGGPFFCAQGQILSATMACMANPEQIQIQTLISKTEDFANNGQIDNLNNLQGQNVFLFSGTGDTVVNQGVMDNLATMYTNFGVNVTKKFDLAVEHCFPTDNYGNQCSNLGSPYINNCNYNGAYEFLKVLNGPKVNPPSASQDESIIQFDQSSYAASGSSLGSTGYLYVPKNCQNGKSCGLHVAFHGCQQTIADIGDSYVRHTEINDMAEANDIIVLYPQAQKSYYNPSNPQGCWDWWWYSDGLISTGNYVTKNGVQMAAIRQMISDLGVSSKEFLEKNA